MVTASVSNSLTGSLGGEVSLSVDRYYLNRPKPKTIPKVYFQYDSTVGEIAGESSNLSLISTYLQTRKKIKGTTKCKVYKDANRVLYVACNKNMHHVSKGLISELPLTSDMVGKLSRRVFTDLVNDRIDKHFDHHEFTPEIRAILKNRIHYLFDEPTIVRGTKIDSVRDVAEEIKKAAGLLMVIYDRQVLLKIKAAVKPDYCLVKLEAVIDQYWNGGE